MKQKGFAPILILILLVALGVAGYFGYKASTLSWKTYTNASHGFSLKYPGSLQVTECANPELVYVAAGSIDCSITYPTMSILQLSVLSGGTDPSQSIQSMLAADTEAYIASTSDFKAGNIVGTKETVAQKQGGPFFNGPQGRYAAENIYVIQAGSIYKLTEIIATDQNSQNVGNTFDQVISTLKFAK